MAKKDSGKKTVLPAIGKPKPKPKKTSARDLGKVANSQFKQGDVEKDKQKVVGLKSGKAVSVKDAAKEYADVARERNKNKAYSLKNKIKPSTKAQERTARIWARATGV